MDIKKLWKNYATVENIMKRKVQLTLTKTERLTQDSINRINSIVYPMVITNDIKDVKFILSKYGTFCDRINYYIADDALFYTLSEEDQLKVFLIDIFYAMQDFAIVHQNHGRSAEVLQGQAMLFLHFLGFYGRDVKFVYGQKFRASILSRLKLDNHENIYKNMYFAHQIKMDGYDFIRKQAIMVADEMQQNIFGQYAKESFSSGYAIKGLFVYWFSLQDSVQERISGHRWLHKEIVYDNDYNCIHKLTKDARDIKEERIFINKITGKKY